MRLCFALMKVKIIIRKSNVTINLKMHPQHSAADFSYSTSTALGAKEQGTSEYHGNNCCN